LLFTAGRGREGWRRGEVDGCEYGMQKRYSVHVMPGRSWAV